MLIRFFKTNQPFQLFAVLPILTFLFLLSALSEIGAPQVIHPSPYYQVIADLFINSPVLSSLITLLIIYLQGVLLNSFVNKYEVIPQRTNLPALFYILIMCSFKDFIVFHPVLLSNLFLILAFGKICSMYRQEYVFSQSFDSGVLISIASLFYFPSAIFILALWFSLMVIRPFIWREYIISLLGFIVPYFITSVYFLLTDNFNFFLNDILYLPQISFETIKFYGGSKTTLLIIYGAFLILSLPRYLAILDHSIVRTQNLLKTTSFLLLMGIIGYFLFATSYYYVFCIVALPLSIFLSNYFLNFKKIIVAEIAFIILLISVIYQHIIN